VRQALPSWAERRRQDDNSQWLFLDGAAIKSELHKSLARNPGEPGAGHLPVGQDAGDWLIRHITSEVWDAKHAVWVKKPGRDNHLLDCLVYAWALACIEVTKPPTPAFRAPALSALNDPFLGKFL
jgi:phage terminase large subunit GpA-like protein